MASWPWGRVEPAGVAPGRAKRGTPGAGDHAAGDPPGVATIAGPDLSARLPLLPVGGASRAANGVVLGGLPLGTRRLSRTPHPAAVRPTSPRGRGEVAN